MGLETISGNAAIETLLTVAAAIPAPANLKKSRLLNLEKSMLISFHHIFVTNQCHL